MTREGMTREEAIRKTLATVLWTRNASDDNKNILTDALIEALEQEPCEDVISRKSIKQKLQEHHDFFVNAYGGFSNLPQNDKSRVDEITNCIAMVVNEPSVTPQEPRKGHWIDTEFMKLKECSLCHARWGIYSIEEFDFCPSCGADMREVEE